MKNTPKQFLVIILCFICFNLFGQLNPMPSVYRTDAPPMSGFDIDCFGANTGMITVIISGGNPPYTKKWKNSSGAVISTSQNLSNVIAGEYTLWLIKGSDSSSWGWTLTQPDQISIELDLSSFYNGTYNISDYGANDGSIHTFVQGGIGSLSYLWSNNSVWDYIEDLTAGSYELTITDELYCEVDTSVTLTQPPALQITSITSPQHNGYNISCHGGEDGEIELTVSGGVPPYNFHWFPLGVFTEDLDSLEAGTYTVIVNDAIAGGQDTAQITLTDPDPLSITFDPSNYGDYNVSCFSCLMVKLILQSLAV